MPFAEYDFPSQTAGYAPIFNTGLPISFPATVGPLVGVDGGGRVGAVGTPFSSGVWTLRFGFTWLDSGALA